MAKFIIEPHFRLQEWVAEEKGYFKDEGLDYEFRELVQATDGKIHDKGDKVGAMQSFEEGRKSDVSCACHWTVNVAASKGHGKLYGDVYSVSPAGIFVAADSQDQDAGRSRRRADLGRLPVRQPLRHHPGARAVPQARADQPVDSDGMLFARMEKLIDGKAPAVNLFSGPYYFAEQLGFRKVHRQHLHDRHHDPRRSGPGRPAQVLPRAARARSATSICGRSSTRIITRTSSRSASTPRWIRGAGARASGSCSSPTPRTSTRNRATGSPRTASSRTAIWAPGATRRRSFRSAEALGRRPCAAE